MRELTPHELAAIYKASDAVERIAQATPDILHGPELVAALATLLMEQSKANVLGCDLGAIGIAAAAIAALVEERRGQVLGERSTAA